MTIPFRKKIARRLAIVKDKMLGYDFLTTVSPEDLGLDPVRFSRCSPSASNYLKNLFNSLKITQADSILDIGCGKGSVLNLLINYEFGKISGIEISKEIFSICKKNLDKKRDIRIEVINQDARYFKSYDDYNYFYMYNPCSDDILSPIIKNIAECASNDKTIIYNFPKYEEILIANGFKCLKKFDDEWGNGIKIFKLYK